MTPARVVRLLSGLTSVILAFRLLSDLAFCQVLSDLYLPWVTFNPIQRFYLRTSSCFYILRFAPQYLFPALFCGRPFLPCLPAGKLLLVALVVLSRAQTPVALVRLSLPGLHGSCSCLFSLCVAVACLLISLSHRRLTARAAANADDGIKPAHM